MGNTDIYKCDTCEFEFVDNYLSFFYDEEQQVTVSYMMLMSTVGISDGSEITGSVRVTYCPDCDKVIKHYIIFNYPKDVDKDMIISKVKEGIKKDKEYSLVSIREYSKFINCPHCNKQIPSSIRENSDCPKCDGKMILAEMFCVD